MDNSSSKAEVLVIASEEHERSELTAALKHHFRVRTVAPAALAQPAPLVDASAAVVLLNGAQLGALEMLLPIRELQAGRGLILLVQDIEENFLEEAICRLDPYHTMTHPTPAVALRLAIRRALPGNLPGQGAREGQRPARALLGVSAAIRELLQQVRQVAPLQVSVLILGETGTGKELVARAIHQESSRARGHFVAVNCSAMPDNLLESELFGYRRGAFTGADRSKKGLFQQAKGGTLFLDEVGDTTPALQAKLLRAIEEREVRPIGSEEVESVDVRVVSATHRELQESVNQGTFRQDLFYRLNTVTIYVPPLRRRRVDIPFLAQHFAEELGEVHARRITLGEDFLDALTRREFPGNVRELRNEVERAIALSRPGQTVSSELLPSVDHGTSTSCSVPKQGTLRERIAQVENEVIEDALSRFGGNRTRVAEALGLSRVGLRQKMRRLGLGGTTRRS